MADPKTGRVVSQDDWKRTQVRMPQELYDDLTNYAENKNISLNTAMITLMNKGLTQTQQNIGLGLPPYSGDTQNNLHAYSALNDQVIEKIANRVVERLKEQK
ncbi:hypothetical protein [Acinetobacter radioresistens]|uniref:hypothetical protein n=1 Tax=Acinetobacter radioresistens TaxID=40216 RepID=UPI00224603CD|nr:hypothetical protein [Acinetobacter radioresistens]MCX0334426.1 hypothetical protein [Acinetobacter radioresistens]